MDFSFPIGTILEVKIEGSPYTYYGRVLNQPKSRASICIDLYSDVSLTRWIDRPSIQRKDKRFYKFRSIDGLELWLLQEKLQEELFRKKQDKIETT